MSCVPSKLSKDEWKLGENFMDKGERAYLVGTIEVVENSWSFKVGMIRTTKHSREV